MNTYLFRRWMLSAAILPFCFAGTSFAQDNCPPPLPTEEQARAYLSTHPAKNSGFLWRLEKDGQISWLFGTAHFNKMEYAIPGPMIMLGARQSDVLLMELNLNDVNAIQPASTDVSKTSKFNLSAQQLARLEQEVKRACLQGLIARDAYNTANAMQFLLAAEYLRSGLFIGYSADIRLAQFAKRSGKPLVALETLQQQMEAFYGGAHTQEQLDTAFDVFLTNLESGKARRDTEELVTIWWQNDLEKLMQFEAKLKQTNPSYAERINDSRNTQMVKKISDIHNSGKRFFAAVGMLHMVGEKGLPKLMQEAGFKVTYVPLK